MIKQSKIDSVLEAVTNILIGVGVALATQLIWFPLIGKDFTFIEHLETTSIFTVISFIRSYVIRRSFNGKSVYFAIKNTFIA